jgi:deazaflavin-dependent oxidoreductase (nitroreductase family)
VVIGPVLDYGPRPVQPAPHRPLELRLLAVAQRTAHFATAGRLGSLDAAAAAPRGRLLAVITAVHRKLYAWTGGLIGGNSGGMPTLLLTTTGRKSGLQRTVPLPYFPHADGWAIVGSFAGNEKHPAWYQNLAANGDVRVQIMRRKFEAVARTLGPTERPGVWADIITRAPMYADYQRCTSREIPVVVLRECR